MAKKRFFNFKGKHRDIVAASEWEALPPTQGKGLGFVDADPKAFGSGDDLAKALAKAQADALKRFKG